DLSEVEKVKQDHPYFVETIELYERAIEEEWNMEKLAENGISLEYEDPTATLPDDYGFQVIKSDDEKIPPLLATGSYINDLPYVHEIYTVDNGKSSRHFVDGIRTHLSIYQDGTIVERYGDRFITFFKINEQGEPDKLASYEFDGNHYISKEESLTENELNDMFAQLAADIGEVNYDFTPFIQDKSETQEANGALSLG